MLNMNDKRQKSYGVVCIPRQVKVSSFIPFNVPIIFVMSVLPPTPVLQFFSQTVNQTYNFGFNYANRNASNSFTNQQLGIAYIGAVSFAITGSLGTMKLAQRLPVSPSIKSKVILISPLIGVMFANTFNLFFSRYKDFSQGINVIAVQSNGKEIEQDKSINAAKDAFIKTLQVRLMTSATIMLGTPLLIYLTIRGKLAQVEGFRKICLQNFVGSISIAASFAASISLYPTIMEIDQQILEPQFQSIKQIDGVDVTKFIYNRGV